jgi:geranylgeranyl pyrophosphate synthase
MNPTTYLRKFGILEKEVEDFFEYIDRALMPYIKDSVKKCPDVFPLKEAVSLQVATGKRRLRAAFCATCCALFNGKYEDAFPYSTAIEHIQNAIMFHDCIDRPLGYYSSKPQWINYSKGQNINIGDVFLSLATLVITDSNYNNDLKIKLLDLVNQQSFLISEGINLELNLGTSAFPTFTEYFHCIRRKSGSFLAMSGIGGAVIGGANLEMIRLINNYASLAATAYDIGEALLDINDKFNPLRGQLIRNHKYTLLTIYTNDRLSGRSAEYFRELTSNLQHEIDEKDVEWICNMYEEVGAVKYAEDVIKKITQNAMRYIHQLPPSPDKEKLIKVSRYYSQRLNLSSIK